MTTLTRPRANHLTIDNVRNNIVGIDAQVPLLDGSSRTYVMFDNAASTPSLQPVLDKVNEFVSWYSSVHRGAGFKSQLSTHVYEETRQIVADFVGADRATHTVIFGKNSTEVLNKLARRFPFAAGDVVLSSLMEHHSNLLPWRRVAHVDHIEVDANGALDEAHLDQLLDQYAGRVRLVVITGASNVTGYINPIHRIARKAHAAGAHILVDGAQLVPHRAVDMRPIDDPEHIDYLIFSAHKMYAPYGTGALVGRKDTFEQGEPDIVGGGTVSMVTVDDVDWAAPPDKDEAGSPNVVGAVALAKTILCLQEIGMDAIADHERQLTSYLLRKLAAVPGVRVYGISDPARAEEKVGVVPFTVDRVNHILVAAVLSAEGGIAVRNGSFCAHPYTQRLLNISRERVEVLRENVRQGLRRDLPGLVRASFGCYNDEAEIDWFIEVLTKIARSEYRGHYVQDARSGDFRPDGFAPDFADYFTLD